MFERFTERARQIVVLAQEEARALKHDHIGTEHLLLGVIREEEGLAARMLETRDITVERVRAHIARTVEGGEPPNSGRIPFTPGAKKAMLSTVGEASALGHKYIGTEHMLLGLLGQGKGAGTDILSSLGVDVTELRDELLRWAAKIPKYG